MVEGLHLHHQETRPTYTNHDFYGSYTLDENGHKVRPQVSREFLKRNFFFNALEASEKVSEAIKSLVDSWDTIPQTTNIKPGDQILYRSQGKIPNIHDRLIPAAFIYEVKAFPDTVQSTNVVGGKVVSINTSELKFTSFGDPLEMLGKHMMKDNKTFEQAIKQMKKVGYLEEVSLTIPASDVRSFKDVNQFLIDNFQLSVSLSSQEHEVFFTSKPF
jgi:hypothetical protein